MSDNKQAPDQSSVLPDEIKALPHWTGHIGKRPNINPDAWASGLTYAEVTSQTKDYGILVAPFPETPYLFIDIDYPDDNDIDKSKGQLTKEEVMQKLTQEDISWGSRQHLELLEPMMQTITNTSMYDLIGKTYTEFSPSGTGLRMIVQSKDKALFKKAYKKAKAFKGQMDFKNQFITITERAYPGTSSTITEVPLMSLADAFGFKQTQRVEATSPMDEAEALAALSSEPSMPTVATMERALESIPIDQNKRVQKVWEELTNSKYEHYDFWLNVGMALHDYGTQMKQASQMYLAYLKWSEKDPVDFKDEEDVAAKWQSFGLVGRSDVITWRTLLKIANRCTFDYPRTIITKKVDTGLPQINEWVNFEYLLDFYNIKLHEDDAYYVSGDEEICEKYFIVHGSGKWFDKYYGPITLQGLQAATLRLCQDSKWRGLKSTNTHVATWITQPREDMDLFQLWLDTPFEDLPEDMRYINTTRGRKQANEFDENSNIDYVFNCLNVQYEHENERLLAKVMLKRTLMQMIKFREDLHLPFTDNGGMLILIGEENTYKSTFFKLLLPRPLEHLRKEANMRIKGDKSVRDFIRNLGSKTIVQIDEFEGIMDHGAEGSLFKAIISGDSASITDIYQTTESNVKRKAILVGTTNEMRQVLSDNGSRRMWFVKVNKIDTGAMLHINLHKLYNDLRDEFRREYNKGNMPWLLTQDEIALLYKMNDSLTAKNDLTMWIEEMWPTLAPMPDTYFKDITSIQKDISGKLYTTRDILQALTFRGMTQTVKLPALERALERHCGRWTNSHGKTIPMVRPRGILTNGRLMQGEMPNGRYKYTKWVMPPIIDEKEDSGNS